MAGLRYMAYGRDPYFAPWQDTAQLNYSNPALHQVMQAELLRLAQWCDGVRCDMAMLCLSDVFGRTWGRLALAPPTQEFWPQAIQAVRTQVADFCFIAEVYWGLESRLQAMGFSLPYDKEFYDALVTQDTGKLRASLQAPPDILAGRLRFLENHDEPRAASRFTAAQQEAAALAILTLPGAVLLHEGQFQGHSTHEPVQLRRRRQEPINQRLQTFYDHLLAVPDVCQGTFYPLQPSPAWGDNATSQAFLAWAWTQGTACWLIVLNYAALQGQCYLNLATLPLAAEALRFTDVLHDITYDRRRTDVQQQGMYFDLPPFGAHLFRIDVNGDT
jgi:hypothetical protein